MNGISVAEAAQRLAVSQRRVRAMIADGLIDGSEVSGIWILDPASLPAQSKRAGQPLSPRIAWALASLADGHRPGDLSSSELSRLRARWRESRADIDKVRSWMSRRAERVRFNATEPVAMLSDSRILRSGRSDERSGMASPTFFEGYVSRGDLDDLIFDHLLLPANGPENVVLHIVEHDVPEVMPALIVAADLADAGARERQQAQILLEEISRDD